MHAFIVKFMSLMATPNEMWQPSLFFRCHFRRLLFSNVGGVKLSAPELLQKQTGKALPT